MNRRRLSYCFSQIRDTVKPPDRFPFHLHMNLKVVINGLEVPTIVYSGNAIIEICFEVCKDTRAPGKDCDAGRERCTLQKKTQIIVNQPYIFRLYQ